MATLKDVTVQAGISVTTASLILNGKAKEKHISDKTIQLVLEVAEQLQYRPNHSARQLRVKTFSRPRVCFYWPLDVRSNLLGYRLAGLQNALVEQNLDYELVVQNYYNNHIEDFIAPLTKGYYDAAIIGGASPHDVETLETMDFSVPIVLLNRESRKFASVGVNNSHVGLQAAVLIQKKGYNRCAVVKASAHYTGSSARTQSFLFTCQQLGIEIRREWIFSGPATIAGGAQATEEFCTLPDRPSVIYYETDCMAQGGAYALHKMGLSVPKDVEILAIGQQVPETMQYLIPSISCIYLPPNSVKYCITLVARMLENPSAEPAHIELEPLVQLRSSFSL